MIAATIEEVGWVGEVYVSALSGRILDGHARVEEAIRTGQPTIPVAYVDCVDEQDEERILATFNPVGSMAKQDDGKLLELVNRAGFSQGNAGPIVHALAGMVGTSKTKDDPSGRIIGAAFGPQGGGSGGGKLGKVGGLVHPIVIECATEGEQEELLEEILEQGHAAYAMDPCPSSMGDEHG